MERWPNLFIVGAQKAGSTSLYEYLKDIPGIYMSPVKEPHYFAVKIIPENHPQKPIRNKKDYLGLFEKGKDEKIVGEASPTYLADPDAPNLIHQVVPYARILISLRDPVERAFSQYFMFRRYGWLRPSLNKQLKIELGNGVYHELSHGKRDLGLYHGLYYENVKRYLDIFGDEQIKIIIFEEFIRDTKKSLQEILKFLGLNYAINEFDSKIHQQFTLSRGPVASHILGSETVKKISEKIIPASGRKFIKEKILLSKRSKPKIDQEDRDLLAKFYYDDVTKLQQLLGRKLPWSNFEISIN